MNKQFKPKDYPSHTFEQVYESTSPGWNFEEYEIFKCKICDLFVANKIKIINPKYYHMYVFESYDADGSDMITCEEMIIKRIIE